MMLVGHERPRPPDPADAPAGLGLPGPDRGRRWPSGSRPSSRSSESAQGEAGCRAAWEAIEAGGDQDLLGFGTVADGALAPGPAPLRRGHGPARPDHSPDWRALGVSILHVLVLDHLLADAAGGSPTCRYVHLLDEVLADVAARGCDLACLVPPAGMEHVEAIASNLETMPPKSTYFYPKLLSGLVLNPLR